MRLTKVLSVVAASLLLALVVCQPIWANTEITHFTYSGHSDKWHTYLKDMAARFQNQTGIKVNILVGTGDYRSQVLTLVAGGVAPDVTDAHPGLAAPLISQGLFTDLTPYVKRDRVPLERMPPSVIQGVTLPSGVMWSLPVSVYPVVTFFNADMFAQVGLQNPIQMGDNWTWNTVTSSAKRLTGDTNGDGTPDRYGTGAISARYEMQVHQAGGQLYDSLVYPTKSRFNTQEVQKAIEWMQSLYLDRVAINSSSYNVYRNNAAFSVTDGPGFIAAYYQDLSFSWDIALQPKGPMNRSGRVNPDGFQVVAHSKQKEAAWQWINYLVSSVDNQLEMARFTGRLPSLKEAMLKYPKITSVKLPSNWAAMIEQAFDPHGYAAYVVPQATVIDPLVNSTLNSVWRGELAAATALQQLHDQITALLKQ